MLKIHPQWNDEQMLKAYVLVIVQMPLHNSQKCFCLVVLFTQFTLRNQFRSTHRP